MPEGLSAIIDDVYAYFFGREMRVGSATAISLKTVTVPVEITAHGDETAVSFTLEYDAAKLRNPQVALGDRAPDGAVLTVNTDEKGRIGILIDSDGAMAASAGPSRLVMITFEVADDASGDTAIRLTSSLAKRGVSNADGISLPTRYLDRVIGISR